MAVAEHPDDPFKPICVQTLVEICKFSLLSATLPVLTPDHFLVLIDVRLMARTGGMRLLLHSLSEGPAEMATLISAALLYIADSPRTRAYLHLGIDLEVVPLTYFSLCQANEIIRWP